MTHRPCVFVVALLAMYSSSVARAQPAAEDCSVVGQNTFVADVMTDVYLWYKEIPTVAPGRFASPEAYLDAIRFRPIDATFSSIGSQVETDAFFGEGQFVGMGFSMVKLGSDVRVTQVFPDSPASDSGLARGDYLRFVNDRSVEELLDDGELNLEFGPATVGHEVVLGWATGEGTAYSATVEKRIVTMPPVSHQTTLNIDGRAVGYLHFRSFVEPSIEALDVAFADFAKQDVSDIVLDLRYNGGGLVSVAAHLAGLIGGARTQAQTFAMYRHNDKLSSFNRTLQFEESDNAIDATRIVIITGSGTASASELIINSLNPFLDVSLVGRRSFGKPVGQYGFDFCEKVLFATSFDTVNAVGDGEYYEGFSPDCPMRDGLGWALGDPDESRLKEALHLLKEGTCTADSQGELSRAATRTERITENALARSGFSQLLNAW